MSNHGIGPSIKDIQVSDSILDEHGSDETSASLPLFAIGSKDAIAEERLPDVVELRAFAELGKLASKDSFDMLRVSGNDDSSPENGYFGSMWTCRLVIAKLIIKVVQKSIVHLIIRRLPKEVDCCEVMRLVSIIHKKGNVQHS